jgi:hypothetical protein
MSAMSEPSASWATDSASVIPAASSNTATLSVLFAVTSFLSSALVFIVEPMFAKMVLPLLGGTPAVWNTCLVFFQAALLAGYGYAHLTTTRLTIRQQAALHGVLLLLAALTLPVALPAGWMPPVDSTPIPWLVLVLTLGLGGPFLMVSASAPLLQKWFAGTDHPAAKDPYFLYSASNIGSILALLSYPLVFERSWPLPEQATMWTAGYALFGALTIGCAMLAVRRFVGDQRESRAVVTADVVAHAPTWKEQCEWVARSFVPSSLLLGVTTYLSTDIAAVPLLWTVPLTLYLLSFVVAFTPTPLLPPRLVTRAMPLLVVALALFMAAGVGGPIRLLIPLHLLTFFVCSLLLHTALAERRPGTRHLTEFYLWLAVGGVLGGAFNTFVAPVLFSGIVEYPIALVAACLLQPWRADVTDRRFKIADVVLPLAVGAVAAGLAYVLAARVMHLSVLVGLLAPVAVWCFSFSARPVRFGLAVGMMLLAIAMFQPNAHGLLVADRTFFGVLRVRADADGTQHVLMHGNTIHGEQSLDAARRREPRTYYHRSGPIGQVIEAAAEKLHGARIGVVGLGAGSLAAYVQPGQRWTFYEIDPAVVRIASDPTLFTYLHECGATCEVVLGDARLSLARPVTPTYRLLVLDAFSSDAIPVHLMTREALELYLRRLETDGILAFHISNRHLDLEPVLAALATESGLAALLRRDSRTAEASERGQFPSEWLVMARRPESFGSLLSDPRWKRPTASAGTRIWADDYSDILAVLRHE